MTGETLAKLYLELAATLPGTVISVREYRLISLVEQLDKSLRNITTMFESNIKKGAPAQLEDAREVLFQSAKIISKAASGVSDVANV